MIIIHYGPYESNGIIRHKIQRIRALLECLNKENYLIEIVASAHLNRISVFLMDREIYRGDIRYLPFNLHCENDTVCQRIVNIIKMHVEMFKQEDNLPKFESCKRGKRWPFFQMTKNIPLKMALNSDISVLFEVGTKTSKLQKSMSYLSNEYYEEESEESILYPGINEIDEGYWQRLHTSRFLFANLIKPLEPKLQNWNSDDSSTVSNVTFISEDPTTVCVDETCKICKGEEDLDKEEEIINEEYEADYEDMFKEYVEYEFKYMPGEAEDWNIFEFDWKFRGEEESKNYEVAAFEETFLDYEKLVKNDVGE